MNREIAQNRIVVAMIKGGVIENMAVFANDSNWAALMLKEGYLLVDATRHEGIDIGWTFNGETFAPPQENTPEEGEEPK